jgi:hypothetical protein
MARAMVELMQQEIDGLRSEIELLKMTKSEIKEYYLSYIEGCDQSFNQIMKERNELQAELEALRNQEPAGTLHDDGYFTWATRHRTEGYNYAGWRTNFYLAAGAKEKTE